MPSIQNKEEDITGYVNQCDCDDDCNCKTEKYERQEYQGNKRDIVGYADKDFDN